MRRFSDRVGTTDRSGRTIERRDKAVAGRVDLPAAEAPQLLAYLSVVIIEAGPPSVIAQRRSLFCRTDDVGKQHGGEEAIELHDRPLAGQELCNFVRNGVPRWGDREIATGKVNELSPVDVFGKITPERNRYERTFIGVQHECGGVN